MKQNQLVFLRLITNSATLPVNGDTLMTCILMPLWKQSIEICHMDTDGFNDSDLRSGRVVYGSEEGKAGFQEFMARMSG